jgi:alpha-ketoglutarate-dependent taurine dioxygenase
MEKEYIKQKLNEDGYFILDKGFSLEEFELFSSTIGGDFIKKEEKHTVIGGNSGRDQVGGNNSVFTATGLKSGHEVPLHGELYFQSSSPPDLLWFYCEEPGDFSDSTWYCDGVKLFESLKEETQLYLLENNGARYHRFHLKTVWQQLYGVNNPLELQQILLKNNVEMAFHPDDESIWTIFESPVLQKKKDKWAFINNILPFGIRELYYPLETKSFVEFGRDFTHKKAMIEEIHQVSQGLTKEIQWKKGMLAIIDNKRTLHGRGKISNFERKVFVRMSYLS